MRPLTGLPLRQDRIADAAVPSAIRGKTLLLATWNVRELGRARRSRAALAPPSR